MPAFGLTDLQLLLSRPDPLLSFKWVCTKLPYDFPTHYVESIDLPFNNIGIGDKTHVASGYYLYPATHNISSTNITFYEDQNARTLKFLNAWKKEVKDFKTGFYGLPGLDGSGYKKTIVVQLLNNMNVPVITASLLGVWPADTGNLSLNYTDSSKIVITQTFSVDDQDIQFHF